MATRNPATPLGGTCDRKFEVVRDAFVANFTDRGEIGAGLCVVHDGRVVVDLWGGHADLARTRPWDRDTLVNVFSIGKAMVATCTARLTGQGLLDPALPVSHSWPEFATGSKSEVTVDALLSHQAGLPAVRRRLPCGAMLEWSAMVDALAAQEPWWEPGSAHGYHTNTFGFLAGELVRRITGRSLGTVLHEEVTGPLGADVHLGLPASADARVAEFVWPDEPPPEEEPPGLSDTELMRFNAYFNPSGLSGMGVVNTRAWRRAEIPSTNAHATARGVARVFTALAGGGTLDGVRIVDPGALRDATVERVHGRDVVLDRPSRFALGFQLAQPERPLGPNPNAFGHFGAGGSLAFCDPAASVAFGYLMNQMGPRWQNPRNRALVDAVYTAVDT